MTEENLSTVLIVDDEDYIRTILNRLLAKVGILAIEASCSTQALEILDAARVDLVFADINLSGESGLDLLREIRKRHPLMPVTMITGNASIDNTKEALRLGAYDYIEKPFRYEDLVVSAKRGISHHRTVTENERYKSNLEAIFSSVRDAIVTVDGNGMVIAVNNSASRLCGIGAEHYGLPLRHAQRSCDANCHEYMERALSGPGGSEAFRISCGHRNRPSQVVSLKISGLNASSGPDAGAVMVVTDETRLEQLESSLAARSRFHRIIGRSPAMQRIYSLIESLADLQTTVLISGRSGTGKELVADAIHHTGKRATKPYVKVNCSALADNLLESELFGHVRGAFTGAVSDKAGRFQKANGGTIFLDEIGDISPAMQVRLLRVLQNREFERVGDSNPIKVDVRIIAATNRDLADLVRSGRFREDLYYRLKVVSIEMPGLAERGDDVLLLANHFVGRFNELHPKDLEGLSEQVRHIFKSYFWPGNVRELEHAIEHAFVVAREKFIMPDDLPREISGVTLAEPEDAPRHVRGTLDRESIEDALKKAGGNKSKAAELLGVNRRTVYRKMEEFGLADPP